MNGRRVKAAAAVLQQQIFVMGGCPNNYEVTASCEVYNIAFDTWSEIATLQEPRFSAGAAVVDNKVYVIGGLGGLENLDQGVRAIEYYSEEKREWQVVCHMPKGRKSAAISTLQLKHISGQLSKMAVNTNNILLLLTLTCS